MFGHEGYLFEMKPLSQVTDFIFQICMINSMRLLNWHYAYLIVTVYLGTAILTCTRTVFYCCIQCKFSDCYYTSTRKGRLVSGDKQGLDPTCQIHVLRPIPLPSTLCLSSVAAPTSQSAAKPQVGMQDNLGSLPRHMLQTRVLHAHLSSHPQWLARSQGCCEGGGKEAASGWVGG